MMLWIVLVTSWIVLMTLQIVLMTSQIVLTTSWILLTISQVLSPAKFSMEYPQYGGSRISQTPLIRSLKIFTYNMSASQLFGYKISKS